MPHVSSLCFVRVYPNSNQLDTVLSVPPIFSLNGTYDPSESFFVGVFQVAMGSGRMVSQARFLGGEFSAMNALGEDVSLLTNSTPALLDYRSPVSTQTGPNM